MPLGLAVRIAAVLAMTVSLYGAHWYIDNKGYQRGKVDVQGKWAKANLDAAADFADKLRTAGEQHDKDQATITRLAADARRMRISMPVCGNSAQTSSDSDGGAGVLQQGVDAAFADLQSRTGALVERCDQLNIDAIRMNGQVGD